MPAIVSLGPKPAVGSVTKTSMRLEYDAIIRSKSPQEALGYLMRTLQPEMVVQADNRYNTTDMVFVAVSSPPRDAEDMARKTVYKISCGTHLHPEESQMGLTFATKEELEQKRRFLVDERGCSFYDGGENEERIYFVLKGELGVNFHLSWRKHPATIR
jgi:hypothetical protein